MRGAGFLVAGMWAVLSVCGCGSVFTEKWSGSESRCSNGNGTSSDATDVELILNGPVTVAPTGTYRWASGSSSWTETDILDATYVGPTLKFTTELRVEFLGQTFVTTTDYELTRTPGKLSGTATTKGSNSTTTCDVDLTPKH